MRLHILPDEKIINRTITYFENVWSKRNKYIIIIPKQRKYCKFVDANISDQIFVTHFDTIDFWQVIGNINDYSSIIIHYLTLEASRFILKINHPNILWIEWGADLYNSFLLRRGFKLYSYDGDKFPICSKLIDNGLKFLKNIKGYKNFKIRYNSVFRIRYFIPDSMYDEYPLFLKYYPEFRHLKYKNFFYYPIEDIIENQKLVLRCSGSSILVGNSASRTNNHLDVLKKLSDINVANEIVIPLSYGGKNSYIKKVSSKATKLFNGHLRLLNDFMPLSEYNKILLNSSFFIFANCRQEAVGNILFTLYIGGKVFLRESNPLYKFYKDLGLIIFSYDCIDEKSFDKELNTEDYLNNKLILEQTYSREKLKCLIRDSFPNEVN